ncbi:MAG: hypothetical protein WCC94_10320, partial [Candidatus Bathyarchaeia archaeon]
LPPEGTRVDLHFRNSLICAVIDTTPEKGFRCVVDVLERAGASAQHGFLSSFCQFDERHSRLEF